MNGLSVTRRGFLWVCGGSVLAAGCDKTLSPQAPTMSDFGPIETTLYIYVKGNGTFDVRVGGLILRGLEDQPAPGDEYMTVLEIGNYACSDGGASIPATVPINSSEPMLKADTTYMPGLSGCPDKHNGRGRINLHMRLQFKSGRWIYHTFKGVALQDPQGNRITLERVDGANGHKRVVGWLP